MTLEPIKTFVWRYSFELSIVFWIAYFIDSIYIIIMWFSENASTMFLVELVILGIFFCSAGAKLQDY